MFWCVCVFLLVCGFGRRVMLLICCFVRCVGLLFCCVVVFCRFVELSVVDVLRCGVVVFAVLWMCR